MKALRKLAPKLGVSVAWLETGEQSPAEQLARLVLDHAGQPLPTCSLPEPADPAAWGYHSDDRPVRDDEDVEVQRTGRSGSFHVWISL